MYYFKHGICSFRCSPDEEEGLQTDFIDDKHEINDGDTEVDFETEMQRELDAAIRLQSDQVQTNKAIKGTAYIQLRTSGGEGGQYLI